MVSLASRQDIRRQQTIWSILAVFSLELNGLTHDYISEYTCSLALDLVHVSKLLSEIFVLGCRTSASVIINTSKGFLIFDVT